MKHGTGVGIALLGHLFDTLPLMDKLSAWVEKENHLGRQFYERNGFIIVAEKNEQVFDMKQFC